MERITRPKCGWPHPRAVQETNPDLWARTADALGDAAFVQGESEGIAGGCGEVGETVLQLENKGGGGQGADGYRGIAAFKPPEGVATDKKTRGHVAGGDAAFASGEREVAAQFAKGVNGRQRHGGKARHGFSVVYGGRKVNYGLF